MESQAECSSDITIVSEAIFQPDWPNKSKPATEFVSEPSTDLVVERESENQAERLDDIVVVSEAVFQPNRLIKSEPSAEFVSEATIELAYEPEVGN